VALPLDVRLTPEYVNSATGLELPRFKWLSDEGLIGEIPAAWNHPAGYDKPRKDASLVRFIIGRPYFNEYASCEYAEEWVRERESMLKVVQRL
jgi:hypothetical protein